MPEERLVAFPGGAAAAAPLVALMEAEFVAGKGRLGALADLYPDVFASPRFGRLFGIVSGDDTLAACGVRLFAMRGDEGRRPGAMIGFVVVAPRRRGRGLGTRLMQATAAHLAAAGVEFGVLWARRPDLYRRLGWSAADTSLLGRWQGSATAPASIAWIEAPFIPALCRRLNRLRPAPAIGRPALVYEKRPYPADRLWAAIRPGAYALIGEAGGVGYVFEVGGSPALAPSLLAAVARRWPDLRINGATDEPISRHLRDTGAVAFEANPLGMWTAFRGRLDRRSLPWIPYLDRI